MVTIPSGHKTMNITNQFTVVLPVQALRFLRLALGVIDIPLLNPPKEINKAEIDDGQEWLIENKLVRKEKTGLAIDPLMIATIQWMADPDEIVVHQCISAQGNTQKAIVYSLHEKELMAIIEKDACTVFFFESNGQVFDHLCFLWKLKRGKKYPENLPELPQPEEAISLAWRDPALFGRVMKEWGMTENAIQEILAFLQSSAKFIISAEYAYTDGTPKIRKNIVNSIDMEGV